MYDPRECMTPGNVWPPPGNVWPPGMYDPRECMTPGNGASLSVCQSFFSVQWHSSSHKFDVPSLYIGHTANQFVDSLFLEKDAQCTEKITHIIVPCIYTMHALQAAKYRIVLLQPRWRSLETPGTSSRAFPNSLNFVTSINKRQTKNLFVKCTCTCRKYAGTMWLFCFNSSGSRLTLIDFFTVHTRSAKWPDFREAINLSRDIDGPWQHIPDLFWLTKVGFWHTPRSTFF